MSTDLDFMAWVEKLGVRPILSQINLVKKFENGGIDQDIIFIKVEAFLEAEKIINQCKDKYLINVIFGPVPITEKAIKPP